MFERENVSKSGDLTANFVIDATVLRIYTYVTIVALCQILNIFGIVTNVINIVCFVKQGFKDTVNISLLGK